MAEDWNSRLVFEAESSVEEGVIFVATEAGGLSVAVAEEKPMDSYNETFECTVHLSGDNARLLRDWLIDMFPLGDSEGHSADRNADQRSEETPPASAK